MPEKHWVGMIPTDSVNGHGLVEWQEKSDKSSGYRRDQTIIRPPVKLFILETFPDFLRRHYGVMAIFTTTSVSAKSNLIADSVTSFHFSLGRDVGRWLTVFCVRWICLPLPFISVKSDAVFGDVFSFFVSFVIAMSGSMSVWSCLVECVAETVKSVKIKSIQFVSSALSSLTLSFRD